MKRILILDYSQYGDNNDNRDYSDYSEEIKNMTDIYCYCPECSKEKDDSVEVLTEKVVLVNGMCVFHLVCGHKVIEKFRM